MGEIQFRGCNGGTIALSGDVLTALRPQLRGNLCLSNEAAYDDARAIWNAMIDRRHPNVRSIELIRLSEVTISTQTIRQPTG